MSCIGGAVGGGIIGAFSSKIWMIGGLGILLYQHIFNQARNLIYPSGGNHLVSRFFYCRIFVDVLFRF